MLQTGSARAQRPGVTTGELCKLRLRDLQIRYVGVYDVYADAMRLSEPNRVML